jgi:FkbM family methyltransferase
MQFYIGNKSPVLFGDSLLELNKEIKILCQYDTKRTCCIDIGANEGYFTVSMASLYKDIHAFEPVIHNYDFLKRNTLSYKNIILHRLAISNKAEEFLMLTDGGPGFNSGMCARIDTYMKALIYNQKPKYPPPELRKEIEQNYSTEIVKAITVDSLNLEPSLIKIDVEGDEQKVLDGAKNTIKKHKPVIYLERNFEPDSKSLDDYMISVGYKQVPEHQWIYIN